MIYKDKKSSCHFDERSEEKSPRDKGAFSGDFSSLLRRSFEMTAGICHNNRNTGLKIVNSSKPVCKNLSPMAFFSASLIIFAEILR